MLSKEPLSALWVGFAALLWSTDAVVRIHGMQLVDPFIFILVEHLLAVSLIAVWAWWTQKNLKTLFRLSFYQWISAMFCGAAGSAIAMIFFSSSLRLTNPSIAILLQKLQPLIVTWFAILLLKEKPHRYFKEVAVVAIASAIALTTHTTSEPAALNLTHNHTKGIFMALMASVLWSGSTIAGKILSVHTPVWVMTFWRFFFGLAFLSCQFFLAPDLTWQQIGSAFLDPVMLGYSLYLSLIPGLFAMLLYYHGLKSAKASTVGIMELFYPLCACLLNALFLGATLNTVQIIAGITLIFACGILLFESTPGTRSSRSLD